MDLSQSYMSFVDGPDEKKKTKKRKRKRKAKAANVVVPEVKEEKEEKEADASLDKLALARSLTLEEEEHKSNMHKGQKGCSDSPDFRPRRVLTNQSTANRHLRNERKSSA